jgi:hypothetical protein
VFTSSAAIAREGKKRTGKIRLYFEKSNIFNNLRALQVLNKNDPLPNECIIKEKIDKNILNFMCDSKD